MKKKQNGPAPEFVNPEPYADLGNDPLPHQRQDAWRMDVKNFVPHVNPMTYFCTSGEAVIKARKLEADLWKAAALARKFANLLEKARAKHKYLELELIGGGIALCKCKDSRPNSRLINRTSKPNYHHRAEPQSAN